jgi:serine/threonine protein kinase
MLIELATGNYPLPVNGNTIPPIKAITNPRAADYAGPVVSTFEGVPVMELIATILDGPEPSLPVGPFSPQFQEFVRQMTRKKPELRLSAEQAISSPWMQICKENPTNMAEYIRLTLAKDPISTDDASDEDEELEEEEFSLADARAGGVGQGN